ncbi:MAG: cyclic nucleotide-binding domain-containing protein [Candidatus Latescibacteria bacterium]|jgi:putative ABC transport system ATP-binding protein|nr:cyclic nucleotide-binding domain-containing protein [Candidatus Latescibacterota bacterium]
MQLNSNAQRFIQIIGKIPMFEGLTPPQALQILRACKPLSYAQREILCEHGTKSTEMFVLLTGTLSVAAPDGTILTSLSPITIVGEMGLITGQPRSATVVAESQISVFEISKIKFEVLIKKFPEIGFKIYRNIIHIISERLDNNNTLLANGQRELANLRDQMAAQPTP